MRTQLGFAGPITLAASLLLGCSEGPQGPPPSLVPGEAIVRGTVTIQDGTPLPDVGIGYELRLGACPVDQMEGIVSLDTTNAQGEFFGRLDSDAAERPITVCIQLTATPSAATNRATVKSEWFDLVLRKREPGPLDTLQVDFIVN
jgi:hypothetical protein